MRRAASTNVALTLGLALGSALAPSSLHAGDRPLELLIANMSPPGTSDACIRDVVGALRDDGHHVLRLGGDRVRVLTGHTDDATFDFMSLAVEELEPVSRAMRATVDAVALVDCRADEGRAEIWMSSAAQGVARLRIRRTTIDEARAGWLGHTIGAHVVLGFEP